MKIFIFILISIQFTLASDVFVDEKTGFMWQDDLSSKQIKKDWDGAVALCQDLKLEGYSDWRLATIKELLAVVYLSEETFTRKEFKNVGSSGYYWSSTEREDYEQFAWMMNFKRAYKYNNYKSYERYVRCVRDNE